MKSLKHLVTIALMVFGPLSAAYADEAGIGNSNGTPDVAPPATPEPQAQSFLQDLLEAFSFDNEHD